MNWRAATWLAWSLFGLYILTVAATLGIVVSGQGSTDDLEVLGAFGYAAVGLLVARRESANAIGWLLLAIAAGFGLSSFAYAYSRSPDHPGVVAVAWFASWSYVVWLYLATMLLPLLFPTGQLLSPRWRIALALVTTAFVLSIVGASFADELDVEPPISNPLAVGGPLGNFFTAAAVLGAILALAGIVLGAISLVLRLRRSHGRERLQVKLFAYVVVALLVDALVFAVGLSFSGASSPAWAQVMNDLGWLLGLLLIGIGLPCAVGIAILRHRLYGIDVVINRTLVYGALTVILGLSYLALVLLFGLVLTPVTSDSELAVAGSTLAVAALFRPARKRIQSAVDRRFYRQRYDASRTLDAFAGRLRDELDLETVAADLREVTRDTLQPAHVSLWLREASR